MLKLGKTAEVNDIYPAYSSDAAEHLGSDKDSIDSQKCEFKSQFCYIR